MWPKSPDDVPWPCPLDLVPATHSQMLIYQIKLFTFLDFRQCWWMSGSTVFHSAKSTAFEHPYSIAIRKRRLAKHHETTLPITATWDLQNTAAKHQRTALQYRLSTPKTKEKLLWSTFKRNRKRKMIKAKDSKTPKSHRSLCTLHFISIWSAGYAKQHGTTRADAATSLCSSSLLSSHQSCQTP